MPHIAIVGAGAAGCFAAIHLKRRLPEAAVTVYESGRRPLAKVAVTGGGRCNLTNTFAEVRSLAAVYPRGERLMKRLLRVWDAEATCRWFQAEGVRLVTQADQCVFPAAQDAMEVVRALTRAMERSGVRLQCEHRVGAVSRDERGFHLAFTHGGTATADLLLVATGGAPKASSLAWLDGLGVERVAPVPSLFTFVVADAELRALTGTVVERATVALPGTKLRADGPLLVTHRGLSGPAVLKLSSYAARLLAERGYEARLSVGWLPTTAEATDFIAEASCEQPRRQVSTFYPRALNARLWGHLLRRAGVADERRWGELSRREANRLVETLTNDLYDIAGRDAAKEEFVTCGGVALTDVDARTLESRSCPGLYLAGEVVDVDAITGGFNLQAAWTMGYVAALAMAERLRAGMPQPAGE
jgi:hypothetical protein